MSKVASEAVRAERLAGSVPSGLRVSIESLAAGVRAGDRRSIARALTLVEEGSEHVPELSNLLFQYTGHATIIGITGPPGAGKSSLVTELIHRARTNELVVGVLAVDPSSPFTGGALLGDRLRMDRHATDPHVFVRSMATRGHLGGLATATPEALRILDASGANIVFVETVGVGQSEVEVATATDTVVVVLGPGFGDALQAAKAGLLEIADIFVVNKADLPGADEAVRHLRGNLELSPTTEWTPPIVLTSTVTRNGLNELWEALEAHRRHLHQSGQLEQRRAVRLVREVQEMALGQLRERIALLHDTGVLGQVREQLVAHHIDPHQAAKLVVQQLDDAASSAPTETRAN